MSFGIKTNGLKEFVEKISKSSAQVQPGMNKGIKKAIFYLEGEVIPKTRVDTGTLRNSYKEKFSNMFGMLYNIRKYGVYLHEGTKFIKGNPYMTDTAKQEAGKINLIMNKEIHTYLAILK